MLHFKKIRFIRTTSDGALNFLEMLGFVACRRRSVEWWGCCPRSRSFWSWGDGVVRVRKNRNDEEGTECMPRT